MNNLLQEIIKEEEIFLNFMKAKYPVFHNSNVFKKDIEYSVKRFLELKGKNLRFTEIEKITNDLCLYFIEKGIFLPVNNITWKVNYLPFLTSNPFTHEINNIKMEK